MNEQSPHAAYRRVLARTLNALEAGKLVVRLPKLIGLRRRSGDPFHATPEIFFQQSGTTRFRMPEEEFILNPGEVCLMPRGMPHGERTTRVEGEYLTLITMFWADGFSLHFGHANDRRGVLSDSHHMFAERSNPLLPRLLDEIANHHEEFGGITSAFARGLLTTAFAQMSMQVNLPTQHSPRQHPLVVRCLDLIQVNLGNTQLSVQWLAAQIGCTPDHLSRAFSEHTGRSLIDSINQTRIDYASDLLERPAFKIGEVAWASGFTNQSYFNRVFRERRGMTPKQYRQAVRPLGN